MFFLHRFEQINAEAALEEDGVFRRVKRATALVLHPCDATPEDHIVALPLLLLISLAVFNLEDFIEVSCVGHQLVDVWADLALVDR